MRKRGSGRRDLVKNRTTSYAQRDGQGRFTDRSEQRRASKSDRRTKAKTKVPSGKGHRGDRS
jgi:hypothetical protein